MLQSIKKLLGEKAPPEPTSAADLTKQGNTHLRNDEWLAAESCYRKALTVDADSAPALVGLGFALQQLHRHDEADSVLRNAIAVEPGNADAHYVRGTIARDQGQHGSAAEHFAKAVDLQPGLLDAYRDLTLSQAQIGKLAEAKAAIQAGIAAHPAHAEFRLILGNLLSFERDYLGAEAAYMSGLSLAPTSPQLHSNLGNALRSMGRTGPALTSYRKAVSYQPDYVEGRLNLANLLRSEQQYDAALAEFEAVVTLAPRSAQAYLGAAGILDMQNKVDEALDLLTDGVAELPDEATLHFARGNSLFRLRRFDEAVQCQQRALELKPDFVPAYIELGNIYLHSGEREKSIAAYKRVLEIQPTHSVSHMIDAISGKTSERAPDRYVASLFDWYAEKFDSHLVKSLKYNMPEQIGNALRSVGHPAQGRWSVLDLGCGTGLAGAAIAEDVETLVGVDLSAKMLERANALKLYARLECAEIGAMMRGEASASYDIVMAADVFVYIGKLDELVAEAYRLLRPGGLLAFSVEALVPAEREANPAAELPDYRLADTGRYTHRREYVQSLASIRPFEVLQLSEAQGRVNDGKPVQGYIAVFRRQE